MVLKLIETSQFITRAWSNNFCDLDHLWLFSFKLATFFQFWTKLFYFNLSYFDIQRKNIMLSNLRLKGLWTGGGRTDIILSSYWSAINAGWKIWLLYYISYIQHYLLFTAVLILRVWNPNQTIPAYDGTRPVYHIKTFDSKVSAKKK